MVGGVFEVEANRHQHHWLECLRLSQIPAHRVESGTAFAGVANGAYVGKKRERAVVGEEWTLARLREQGFKLVPWRGE